MNHLKPSRPFRIMASIATIALLFGCNNGDSAQKQKEIELKEREIALKEQELANNKKAQLAQDTQAAAAKSVEKIVRREAMVITQSGGNAILRSQPSKSSRQIEKLYDSERILVVGQTSACEVINNHQGCWVKIISSSGASGYLFDAYLQYM